ncbi:MAG: IS110 family transposase [Acidimicrobiia bacterium]|jgi:transposase
MTTIAEIDRVVTGGVDTHTDVHVAAVVDATGKILGSESFPTTIAGFRSLLAWMRRHGTLDQVGVEGTGAYGAGLARFLTGAGVKVVEVDRPNRQLRRSRGKSDTIDAEHAARAVLSGEATGTPKTRNGTVECVRALRVVRRSAVTARTAAGNQLVNLVLTAPEELRGNLRGLSTAKLVAAAAAFRPATPTTVNAATKLAMREAARRHQGLTAEIARLETAIGALVTRVAPELLKLHGVGLNVAAALLVTVGDNPSRLRNEASFAHLCGVAPIPASTGRTTRHRLNRGGDRQANNALWRIALVRMSTDPATRDYVERRTKEGLSKREIIRCLKRYIAREVFTALPT